MVQPMILKKQSGVRFFYNIDSNVGTGSPNLTEDVQLVQFGYFAASQNAATPADQKAIFAAVKPGAPYSGGPNDPLTIAILSHQKSRGGVQDGHVSVIKGTAVYDGTHSFMLVALVNTIFDLIPQSYPRIDKHPNCPAALRAAVLRCCSL